MIALVSLLGGWRATAFAAIAAGAIAFSGVQTVRLARAERAVSVNEKALAITAKEHAEYRLRKEREIVKKLHDLSATHLAKQTKANEDYQDTIAAIRSDALKLRDRFVCPAPAGGSPGGPGSDGGAPTGLLGEDAEFLVSEAKRADDVVRQLILAQGTIRTLQEAMEEHDKLHAR